MAMSPSLPALPRNERRVVRAASQRLARSVSRSVKAVLDEEVMKYVGWCALGLCARRGALQIEP